MDELVQWREFYAAVAGAAAALIGLVYVGISIQLGRHAGDQRMRLFGTMSAQNFLHPLLVALAMLLPVEPVVQAGLLLALGVAGLVNTLGTGYYELRHPQPTAGGERRLMTMYRYGMTLVASTVLAAGAVGLLAGWRPAIYAPALFIFLMFLVGVENAWALLLGTAAASTDKARAQPAASVGSAAAGPPRRMANAATGDDTP